MVSRLSEFDFDLPEELIAQTPAIPRDGSRLLVLHRARGTIEHRYFRDFPGYFDDHDLLVANNTRVLKARLLGHRLEGTERAGKVEFVLLEEQGPGVWEGLFHASARHKRGLRFEIPTPDGHGLRGELIRASIESEHGTVVARFDRDPVASGAGEIPLPKYIRRSANTRDLDAYQTLYAGERAESAAAPTAGLHFTREIIEALHVRGAEWAEVTLSVGLGTFRPVKEEDLTRHPMHEERYSVSETVAEKITAAKRIGKRITAIGTTSVRTLESAWLAGERRIASGTQRTSIFFYPGSPAPIQVVDRLLTNFHLPRSTLLMLVSAFAGSELIREAYAEAVREKYRFFSYGDAMLIL